MGVSEERIGQFLKNNRSATEFFKIATKGGIQRQSDGSNRFNNSREHLTKALDDSLAKESSNAFVKCSLELLNRLLPSD